MSTGTHPLYVAIASFVLFVSPISTSRAIAEPPVTGALVDVVATQAVFLGRQALALELTPEEQARQLAGAGGNRPTFALVPGEFQDGVIEVDVAAELNGKGGRESRGFVGVVFHLAEDERFEAVYLRVLNGTLNDPMPPSPRDERAIQYILHPQRHFDVLRTIAAGRYERPAPVAVGRWHRLRLEIRGSTLTAMVDGETVLTLDDLDLLRPGAVGLWVGDGTSAYFANLTLSPEVP
jgi:hypothetical protein